MNTVKIYMQWIRIVNYMGLEQFEVRHSLRPFAVKLIDIFLN